MSKIPGPTYRAELFASAEQAPTGRLISLGWEVVASEEGVASVQFASATESGLEMIEAVPAQGVRQIIFARPGLFRFTLTALFRDGVRRSKQIQIRVTS